MAVILGLEPLPGPQPCFVFYTSLKRQLCILTNTQILFVNLKKKFFKLFIVILFKVPLSENSSVLNP